MAHPAKYTDSMLPIFANMLRGCNVVLDPFAGTGKLGKIREFGFTGRIICNELEEGFKEPYDVEWHFGDSESMPFLTDASVDAICTSPTYGNRMADTYVDGSKRITYTNYLGHALKEGNTGCMQFGSKYKDKHTRIYSELHRVLKRGGVFILNMSNHIRAGKEVDVFGWHKQALDAIGFKLVDVIELRTPRMGFGKNSEKRCSVEYIAKFIKQ